MATLVLHGFLFAWHQVSLPFLSAYLSFSTFWGTPPIGNLSDSASFPWSRLMSMRLDLHLPPSSLLIRRVLSFSFLYSHPFVCENFSVLHLIPLLVFKTWLKDLLWLLWGLQYKSYLSRVLQINTNDFAKTQNSAGGWCISSFSAFFPIVTCKCHCTQW